jgi:glutamate N-acetyltransferase/amino-acid N-acetyltransferase
MFTKNNIKAAPVKLDMKRIKSGKGQAIIVNSGNANACTGEQGMKDAAEMTGLTAKALGLKASKVYVCSTGVIGTPMPMERIKPKILELANNLGRATIDDVAKAIMTTDTFPKALNKRIKIDGKTITISAVCKGAGMICPNMATMLCFIVTDANIDKSALDNALKSAVQKSFNRITIDGDMSTNDTVLIMANGMADNELIAEDKQQKTEDRQNSGFRKFSDAISDITYELSRMIVKDGEGATKLVEIEIKNAKNEADAEKGAFAIANSMLVKTAIYGNDANWGRIMAALGYSGITMKEENVDIFLNGLKIVSKGMGTGMDKEANEKLKSKEIKILADLHLAKGVAKVLTCDLTEDYVRINAEYRT